MDLLIIFQIILLVFLLLVSALVSGSEIAFFSLSNSEIEKNNKEQVEKINRIKSLLKKPKRLLATILITNNFINIAIVLIFANLSRVFFKTIYNPTLTIIIEIGIITLIILLFGEILPKVYANRNAIGFANLMSKPIKILDSYILFFLTSPMSRMTYFLENKLGGQSDFSVDQLSQALELTSDKETTKEEE